MFIGHFLSTHSLILDKKYFHLYETGDTGISKDHVLFLNLNMNKEDPDLKYPQKILENDSQKIPNLLNNFSYEL